MYNSFPWSLFQVFVTNLSPLNPTLCNGVVVNDTIRLSHKDIITITERSFRFEYPPGSTFRSTPVKPVGAKLATPKGSRTPLKTLTAKVPAIK